MKKIIVTVVMFALAMISFAQNYTMISGSGFYKHSDAESIGQAKEAAAKEAHKSALVKYISSISQPGETADFNGKIDELLSRWDEITTDVNYTKNEYNLQIKTFYSDVTAKIDADVVRNTVFGNNGEEEAVSDVSAEKAVEEETDVKKVKYREEDLNKKAGFNIVFGGGFNLMKSWENFPNIEENLDDIPGAGLVGLRLEYDFGQFMNFPNFCFFAGSDVAITQIGDIPDYSTNDSIRHQFNHTTFISEVGLLKKFFVKDEFALYIGGSYVMENMDIKATPDYPDLNGGWKSSGYRGLAGLNFLMGNAWFFDLSMSYTGMGDLENSKGDKVFEEDPDNLFYFPDMEDKGDKYLVPDGFSLKIALGLRI
ncbi:MAG: hypothetical protein JXN63_02655 [Candidatus Delongbacteria bacterium]|nr:hypothetical protein [Candidatus Delongbacteria bacterium]